MLILGVGGHSRTELPLQGNQVNPMLLILKPILMTAWKSRAFKELIVAMLEKIVTQTDNDLDDLAVNHLKILLLPDTRVEK